MILRFLRSSVANASAFFLFMLLAMLPSRAQSTAETAEAIQRDLDAAKAEFVANLQAAIANPENLQSGQTKIGCEQILSKLDQLVLRINETADLLAKRENDLVGLSGLGQAERIELKEALQSQRKPLDKLKKTTSTLQTELKTLLDTTLGSLLETYSSFQDIAGPAKAHEKLEVRLREILSAYPDAAPIAEVAATSASSPPKATVTGGSRKWQTYEPGRIPRGRLIAISDIAKLANRGTSGDRIYLQGNFEVTASGNDRAVLRSLKHRSNVRIILQYPEGMEPPQDGSQMLRDASRPLQIMDVGESAGGQLNVYAREVTRP